MRILLVHMTLSAAFASMAYGCIRRSNSELTSADTPSSSTSAAKLVAKADHAETPRQDLQKQQTRQINQEAQQGRDRQESQALQDGGRVAVAWQKGMLDRLRTDPAATRAYGLFSSGGWSDAGQVIVLTNEDGTRQRLIVVKPGETSPATDRALTAAEWQTLEASIAKAHKLPDVDIRAFDHLIFEYVAAQKENLNSSTVSITDRLFISNPGSKDLPEHDDLIAAFQALRSPSGN